MDLFILTLLQLQGCEPKWWRIPVSVVRKLHLICFQFRKQQHQYLDKNEENHLKHMKKKKLILKAVWKLTCSRATIDYLHLNHLSKPRLLYLLIQHVEKKSFVVLLLPRLISQALVDTMWNFFISHYSLYQKCSYTGIHRRTLFYLQVSQGIYTSICMQ